MGDATLSTSATEQQTAPLKVIKLSDVLRTLGRGAPIAIVTTVVAIVVAVLVTRATPPTYEASVSLLAAQPQTSFGSLELAVPPQVDPRAFQSALLDGSVVRDALFKMDGVLRDGEAMTNFKRKLKVSVENQLVSSIVRIGVQDSNPRLAANYANAIADELVSWDRGRARRIVSSGIEDLERAIADIDVQIAEAPLSGNQEEAQRRQVLLAALRDQRVRELDAARARSVSAVVVGVLQPFSPALVPDRPIAPRMAFNTLLAVVLGLILGYGIQFLRWSLRDEVGSRERLAVLTRLPLLGVFPRAKRVLDSPSRSAASFLRTSIKQLTNGELPVVIGLTSAASYSEKSGVGFALVEGLVVSGHRTLLIDADLVRQGPGSRIDVSRASAPGLEHYLRNPSAPLQPLSVDLGSRLSFGFIPTIEATNQSSELIEFGLRALLNQAKTDFDAIVIELPPVTSFADALAAAPACTVIALCAGIDSSAAVVEEAADLLRHWDDVMLGVVLTGIRMRRSRVNKFESSTLAAKRSTKPLQGPGNLGRSSPRAVVRVKNR